MTARLFLATLLGFALLLGTVGCSLVPDPPAATVSETNKFEAIIRALPGVAAAKAGLSAVDAEDDPGQFSVSLVVTAERADGLETVPGRIAGVSPPSGLRVDTVVIVPEGPGVARVALMNSLNVARAEKLRRLPMVESVSLDDRSDRVQVAQGVSLASAVTKIRESGTLTSDPFDSITIGWREPVVDVAVSAVGPSPAVLTFIEDRWPQFDRFDSSEPSELSPRPTVNVVSSNPDAVAKALVSLAGDHLAGRPRTGFSVSSETDTISGFVGLPLGSPEPGDLAVFDPVPPPVDEAARAAQVAADSETITRFLLDSAEVSGVPGDPDVFEGECPNTNTHVRPRVQGTLLLPVFEYADTADPAYDAITESWEAAGYTHSEQAMGTAIFTPSNLRRIAQLTIRGTNEGIVISVLGVCVN